MIYCHVKLKSGNASENESGFKEEYMGKYFVAETTIISVMTRINFDFEDNWIFDLGHEHHLMGIASKFSSFESYDSDDAIIAVNNTIHPYIHPTDNYSVTFISQGIIIDDSSADKVEYVSEVITNLPTSSRAPILSMSSFSFLVGEKSERGDILVLTINGNKERRMLLL